MIDLSNESVLSLTEAAKLIPKRRRGKPVNLATLYRWTTRGIQGIRLESIQVGGTRCTSKEALQRFFDRLSGNTPIAQPRPTSRKLKAVQARLDRDGIR